MANRIYRKYENIRTTIDNAEYTNNDPVGADIQAPTITIINWDDVKTLDQISIHTQATLEGFSVV